MRIRLRVAANNRQRPLNMVVRSARVTPARIEQRPLQQRIRRLNTLLSGILLPQFHQLSKAVLSFLKAGSRFIHTNEPQTGMDIIRMIIAERRMIGIQRLLKIAFSFLVSNLSGIKPAHII